MRLSTFQNRDEHPRAASNHFAELDGMRGILACAVMLFHLGLNNLIQTATLGRVSNGQWHLSVDFFFILSGLVICASFNRNSPSIVYYFIRRIRRLVPLYLVATLVALLLSVDSYTLFTIFANVFMVQPFIGAESINYPSWTIPFELVIPAIFLIMPNLYSQNPALSLTAFCTSGIILTWVLVSGEDYQLLRATSGLGTGFALYKVIQHRRIQFSHPSAITLLSFAGVALVMLLSGEFPVLSIAFYPLSVLAIVSGIQAKTVLSTPPLQALGRWSYGIYLLHIPVLAAVTATFGNSAVDGNPAMKIAVSAIVIALSALAHVLVEKPFMTPPTTLAVGRELK